MNPLFSLNFLFVYSLLLAASWHVFETQLLPLDKRYHAFLHLAYPEHFLLSPNALHVASVFASVCSLHPRYSWSPLLNFLLFSGCLWCPWDSSPGHRRYSGGLSKQNKAVSSKDFSQAYFELDYKDRVNVHRSSNTNCFPKFCELAEEWHCHLSAFTLPCESCFLFLVLLLISWVQVITWLCNPAVSFISRKPFLSFTYIIQRRKDNPKVPIP